MVKIKQLLGLSGDEDANEIRAGYYKTLTELERKERTLRIIRFIAWIVMGIDAWLSFRGFYVTSGSLLFSIAISLLIASIQWLVATSIYNKSAKEILTLDLENISIAEILRFAFVISCVIGSYTGDFFTNMAGIDATATGAMVNIPFGIAPVHITMFFSFFFCIGDEGIHYFGDTLQSYIDKNKPVLRRKGTLQRLLNDIETGFARELSTQGVKLGEEEARKFRL